MEWVRAVIATTLGVGPNQDLPPLIMQQETHSIWEQICTPHLCTSVQLALVNAVEHPHHAHCPSLLPVSTVGIRQCLHTTAHRIAQTKSATSSPGMHWSPAHRACSSHAF